MISGDLWNEMGSLCVGAVELAGALFVQSSVLIVFGLLAAMVFRRSGSAVASAIYRTTLVAVVACPVGSLLLLAAGVPGLEVSVPGVRVSTLEVAFPGETTQSAVVREQASDGAARSAGETALLPAAEELDGAKPIHAAHAAPAFADDHPVGMGDESVATSKVLEYGRPDSFSALAGIGAGLWFVVSGVLMLRLAGGQILLGRLRRRAHSVDLETASRCRVLADQMGVECPLVLWSPFVSSPCLVGLLRPAILLPESDEAGGGGTADILLHELAHLSRRDCLWNCLAVFAAAVLWFGPFVWMLRRRVIRTAEEVCDDHVIAFGFDEREYARNLTRIAERYQPAVAAGAVAVASLKSWVGRRVVRILDTSRTMSTRTGGRAVAAMGSTALVLTSLVGLVSVGGAPAGATGAAEEPGHVATPSEAERPAFLGPSEVVASPDGKALYVVNAGARQVVVVDPVAGKVLRSIAMPAEPTGVVISPSGATLYVTCAAPEGTVAVVDVESGRVGKSISVGHWPMGPAISPDGKTLYVCNRFDDNVAVVGLETGRIAMVPATREPYAAVVTPDGKSVFVINHLPIGRADSYEMASVVTVIDTATNETRTIRLPNGSTGMRGVCVSPDGRHVYATHLLSRYQMPTTQVERGWMNTNALSIIDANRKELINTVLLDDIDLGAANPWGVALTVDGKTICVTHAGTHEVSIIDGAALTEKLSKLPATREEALAAGRDKERGTCSSLCATDVPNDLRFLFGLRRRVSLADGGSGGKPAVYGPRGLVVVGSKALVAGYFSDNLAVVDLKPSSGDPESGDFVGTVALGPATQISVERRGEMLFNDATLCFQHWQSCGSCHPGARGGALNWDLMNDGMGNPKNGRSMLLAHKTPPSMSSGVRPDAEATVRRKFVHLLFAVGAEKDAVAIDEYLKSLGPIPSPYLVDGKLSPAAQRGKKLFFDAKINCAKCHPEPLFTDMLMYDVGSRGQFDRRDTFDTPTLIECWRTAPYMHDGRYTTVKQLLIEGKHGNGGEQIVTFSEEQVNDLAEYVLSL